MRKKGGRPGPPERHMAMTTVTLRPEVYRRLQHIAVDEGTNVRELVRKAVDQFLEKRRTKK
jgi:predicted transcriptional regulator